MNTKQKGKFPWRFQAPVLVQGQHMYLFLAIDTPFYTVHQSLRQLQALTSLVTPKTFCSLQIMQVLGLPLGDWGILVIAGLEQPHLSASVPRHTALLCVRAWSGRENEEQCTNCVGVLSRGMQKFNF